MCITSDGTGLAHFLTPACTTTLSQTSGSRLCSCPGGNTQGPTLLLSPGSSIQSGRGDPRWHAWLGAVQVPTFAAHPLCVVTLRTSNKKPHSGVMGASMGMVCLLALLHGCSTQQRSPCRCISHRFMAFCPCVHSWWPMSPPFEAFPMASGTRVTDA